MADQKALKLIGWALGGITATVMLVAALLVHDAIADPSGSQVPFATSAVAEEAR